MNGSYAFLATRQSTVAGAPAQVVLRRPAGAIGSAAIVQCPLQLFNACVQALVVHLAVDSRWRGSCGQPDGQPDGQAAPAHRLPTRLTTLAHSGLGVRGKGTIEV